MQSIYYGSIVITKVEGKVTGSCVVRVGVLRVSYNKVSN